jgi:hypothetical protein
VTALACAGVAVFAVFHLLRALAGRPVTSPDTLQYIAIAARPILSRAFLAGSHPPLTPLVWKVSGDAETFVVVQTCISILAWSVLAWIMGRVVGGGWRGLGAGAVVLGFASTSPIMQWNRAVLSESLALSALALLFASGIWWAEKPDVARAVAFTGAAALFCLVRDSDILVVALLAVVFAAWAMVRRATVPRVAWVAVVGLGLVTIGTLAASMESRRFDVNLNNIVAARVLPYHDRVVWWADHGMPQAREIEAAVRKYPCRCGDAPVVSWRVWHQPRFSEISTWLHDNGRRVYLEWMLTHPDYVVAEPFRRPERAAYNHDRLSAYVPEDSRGSPLLTGLLYPPWPFVVAASAAVIVAMVVRRDRRRVVLVLALLGVLGLVHMFIAWHGDGMEGRRHGLEGNAQTRLAVLLLLLVVFLDPLKRYAFRGGEAPVSRTSRRAARTGRASRMSGHQRRSSLDVAIIRGDKTSPAITALVLMTDGVSEARRRT